LPDIGRRKWRLGRHAGQRRNRMKQMAWLTPAVLSATLSGIWGCSDGAVPTTPGAWRPGAAIPGTPAAGALSATVVTALNDALQDEIKAETTYLGVVGDFGDVRPFANIVSAEQRHSESIARVFSNHGLAVPGSLWTLDSVPHFGSLAEACAAAAAAELANVALYDRYLVLDLPLDARTVFENNRAASLERHLPAFQACSCAACPRS
jgi:hypothetical protein